LTPVVWGCGQSHLKTLELLPAFAVINIHYFPAFAIKIFDLLTILSRKYYFDNSCPKGKIFGQ